MRARSAGLAFGLAAFLGALPALADTEANIRNAQGEVQYVGRELGNVQAAVERAKSERMGPEQRVANGEILYRSKDYSRAIVVFSEIIEEYPNTPSYVDSLWLRGETYYASKEYLAARRDYRAIVDRGSEPRFAPYFGKALARLVDVVMRLNEPPEALKDIFDKFNQVPPAQVDAALLYAKGKAHYKRQEYSAAQQVFASIPNGTPYTHQSRYFAGLVALKIARSGQPAPDPTKKGPASANYKQAVETFRTATVLPPDTPEHRHVIDLSWMAIGRLFYEMEQYQQASEAYARVGRDSPAFDTMLYELAWVYVRLGDVQRAERALEVLSISDPGSQYMADGTLLRADLLLRAGAFDKALQLYETVRNQYDPMRAKVESFLDQTKDPAVYYEKLSQQQLDVLDQNDQLPALAVRWAREAEDGPLAFAVIDDINTCKTLIKQSNILVERLVALTNAANRVRAFPELLAGEEAALGLINRLSRGRMELAKGLDAEEPGDLGGEIGNVRAQRRQLMGMMQQLPTTQAEFAARDQAGTRQWNTVSQELTRRGLEVDHLQAAVNGLRRWLREDAQRGVQRDPETIKRFTAEIDASEKDLKHYRESIAELRRMIEIGRAQVGLGDARFQADAQARQQFRDLLDREVQLAGQGQAGSDAQRYAGRVQPILANMRQLEDQLTAAFARLEAQVEQRIGDLKNKIETERQNLIKYQGQLDALDAEARDLVGKVAERNFGLVRDKLRGIVLRADVGITEQAWEVREEEADRVRNLLSERARQEQLLDEELREVRDDGIDPAKPATPPQK
jgi:tetratricopeptide (TPR) repeat protein